MRRVTRAATFGLHRSVFVQKRSLLISVALDATGISSCCQTRLFQFKTAVRIVTITTTHRALKHLVVERHVELRLHLRVTARAKLRIIRPQHASGREARLLAIRRRRVIVRTRKISARGGAVRRVTVNTTDIVAPVFSTFEVVALFLAGVTCQTGLGSFLRRLVLERNDLGDVSAAFDVRLTWAVTRFASGHLIFPIANLCELRVRSV